MVALQSKTCFWLLFNKIFENVLECVPEVFGGVPQNFGRVCCSIGPPKTMFYCIFKKEFWECVVLWDQIFLEKSPKNSKTFRKFYQKISVLRFKMVLNGKILMNFNVISHKTPHRLFFEKYKNFENF